MMRKLTYKQSGLDYSKLDPIKVLAQKAARRTIKNLPTGFTEVRESRGESAYVVDCGSFYLASITECLGTKVLVADAMRKITGKTYYDSIAQDTVAMAVNDIVTVGAMPKSIHAYWAAGSSKWFDDIERAKDLVRGWEKACHLSGASWGGGETPGLKGVVCPKAIDLAASCVGVIKPKRHLILGNELQAGDAIVVFASSGIHANGLTLARKLADRLPEGYATKVFGRRMYGEALLCPTIIYSSVIRSVLRGGIDIHYMSNITGHGWRKIMRHPANFTYRITEIPPVPAVLKFIAENCLLSVKEAYGSLNMGAGLAMYVDKRDVKKVAAIAAQNKIKAYAVGSVEEGPKQVAIEPLNVIYKADSLRVRG